MLPQDNLAAYRELADSTSLPLCLSERLMTRFRIRRVDRKSRRAHHHAGYLVVWRNFGS